MHYLCVMSIRGESLSLIIDYSQACFYTGKLITSGPYYFRYLAIEKSNLKLMPQGTKIKKTKKPHLI